MCVIFAWQRLVTAQLTKDSEQLLHRNVQRFRGGIEGSWTLRVPYSLGRGVAGGPFDAGICGHEREQLKMF